MTAVLIEPEGINLADPCWETDLLVRETLSHTTLNLLLNCQRKYQFAKLDRLEPIETRPPLMLGRAFHEGIEHGDPAVGATAVMRASPEPHDQKEADDQRIASHTVGAAVAAYIDTWRGGGLDGEDTLTEAAEYEYQIRIRNPWTGRYSRTFDFRGFADQVIFYEDHLELVENKLVGQLNATQIKKLKLDRQISLCCYALWRATGKPVRVVHYRYVRKPSIRQKSGESIDQFIERLHRDYEERADFYTHGESLYRDERDLLDIECELWAWAQQVLYNRAKGFYPRNTSHCSDYGGCEFLPLCCGDPDAISRYRVRPVPTITPEESE